MIINRNVCIKVQFWVNQNQYAYKFYLYERLWILDYLHIDLISTQIYPRKLNPINFNSFGL